MRGAPFVRNRLYNIIILRGPMVVMEERNKNNGTCQAHTLCSWVIIGGAVVCIIFW